MAETWQIIRDGVTTNISSGGTSGFLWTLQAVGIGAPPKRNISVRGPQQHGHSIVDFRYDARQISLVFGFEASSLTNAEARRDQAYSLFAGMVGDTIKLRVTRHDGEVRQIDAEISGIVDPAKNDTRLVTMQKFAVTLECGDPFWYDPTVDSTTFDETDNLDWWLALGTITSGEVEEYVEAPTQGQSVDNGVLVANGSPWSVVFQTNVTTLSPASFEYAFNMYDSLGLTSVFAFIASGLNRVTTNTGNINGVIDTGLKSYMVISDGATAYAYRDGTLIGSVAATKGIDGSNSNTRWRSDGAGTSTWTPAIPYGAIYNVALDSTQRAALLSALSGAYTASKTITNDGNWSAYPVIYIDGPIEDPILVNTTTGEVLDFTGITIASGDTYIIDCRYGRKTVKNAAGTNKIVDLTAASDLATFHLEPGDNAFTLEGTSTDANTQVTINFYPRYLGI